MTDGFRVSSIDSGHPVLHQEVMDATPLHDMSVAAKEVLATELQLYTTTAPRDPGTFRDFRQERDQQRAHDTIAEHVRDVLGETAAFKDEVASGTLGLGLIETFGAVTEIRADDIHLADPTIENGQEVDGTAVAGSMTFTVSSPAAARNLNVAFQALLRKRQGLHPVYLDPGDETRPPTVTVEGLSEHTIRSVGRAVGAVVAKEDRAAGFVLPPVKRSLAVWKEQSEAEKGETFPLNIEARLTAANLAYRGLVKAASYRNRPELGVAIRQFPNLLGTDAAPMFQGTRDIMNGLIWAVRKGSHRNLEQDPDRGARLSIEDGVELKRDPVTLADIQYGPPTSRTLSPTERVKQSGRTVIVGARKNPFRATVKLAKKPSAALSTSASTPCNPCPSPLKPANNSWMTSAPGSCKNKFTSPTKSASLGTTPGTTPGKTTRAEPNVGRGQSLSLSTARGEGDIVYCPTVILPRTRL